MRAFSCDRCGQLVFFENSVCLSCGSALGYVPTTSTIVAFDDADGAPAGTAPKYTAPDGSIWWPCANLSSAGCNWLTGPDDADGLCRSCALTRTRPAVEDTKGMAAWLKAEAAKRRMLFQLYEIGLPVVGRSVDPGSGLAFDLLSSVSESVVTGHDDGLITVDLAEGSDPHREAVRVSMGEAYRTMLGHFRHEIGHYYWNVLIMDSDELKPFRDLFGDDELDYQAAIERHYNEGPPEDWKERYVSSYATMHPWEDFAETFAHYLHIHDTLQTASAFGVKVSGPAIPLRRSAAAPLAARPIADAEALADFDVVLASWFPLTYALNAVNRSMGKDDLYPFVLPPAVIEKLAYVHQLIRKSAA